MRRLTNNEFLLKLKHTQGDKYTPLEEYNGAITPIKFKCNKCGDIFMTTPDKIYVGGCLKCGYEAMKNKQRKTNDYFIKEVFNLVGDEYKFLDKYINNTTKLRVKHNKCGHEYSVTPRDFLQGRRCPKCKNKRISESVTLAHDEYMERLSKVLESDYEVLDKYKNARTKITVKHNKCGSEYKVSPSKLLSGNRCRYCVFKELGVKMSKSHDVFVDQIKEMYNEEFEVLGEYKNNRTKIEIKHNKCGFIYEVAPDALLRGNGCPKCKESKGEKLVSKILTKHKIKFKPQFKFDDCKYKDKLSFDFALFKENEIIGLIEYQGIQHYKPVEVFGGQESFEEQCIKDDIKRKYAKDNDILLIEIPYYIKDVETYILDKITKSIPR